MKFVVLGFLLLLSLPGLGQEGQVTRPEDLQNRVQVIESQPPLEEPGAIIPDPSLQNNNPASSSEEDDIARLEAERAGQGQAYQQIDQANEAIKEKIFNGPEELAKLGYETLDAAALMDEKVVAVMQKMFAHSPLKGASRKEVVELILQHVQGKPGEEFLRDNPRLMYAFADILRDDKAMPSIIGILARRDSLKMYFFIWLSIMIASFLIKKFYFKKQTKWSPTKRLLIGIGFNLGVMCTTFTIFYNIFESELSPTTKILVQHWRRRNLPASL